MTDSNYAMFTSENLLKHHTFTLDRYRWPAIQTVPRSGLGANTTIYQLESVNGHLFYYFPPGTSILSTPYVALLNAFGISSVNPDGSYRPDGELAIQGSLAALLMALATAVFFYTSTLVLPLGWSIVLALGSALGTQVWSTASRVMWSDTWAIVLTAVIIFLLLSVEIGRRWTWLSSAMLAPLLAWSYFVRPTNSVAIVAITIYVIAFQRRFFLSYALTGVAWFVLLVIYSWHNFGLLLPYYFRANRLHFGQYWEALAGNLISPSRGLLIFVPALFFVGYLLSRYWRELPFKRLAVLTLVIAVGHLLTVAAFVPWHGGGCYGARYSAGLAPWFTLLAVIGVRALLDHGGSWAKHRGTMIAGGALLALSIFINARGAVSYETSLWNDSPVNVDRQADRVWDWRYPQFLAGLVHPPLPQIFPNLVEGGKVDLTSHTSARFLWYGWSSPEPDFRWTASNEATVIFAVEKPVDLLLKINATPFLAPAKVERQQLLVSLNDKAISTLVLDEAKEYELALPLSAKDLLAKNILKFSVPYAVSPRALKIGYDSRHLGIAVRSISFEDAR
jgi:hypothetical protein